MHLSTVDCENSGVCLISIKTPPPPPPPPPPHRYTSTSTHTYAVSSMYRTLAVKSLLTCSRNLLANHALVRDCRNEFSVRMCICTHKLSLTWERKFAFMYCTFFLPKCYCVRTTYILSWACKFEQVKRYFMLVLFLKSKFEWKELSRCLFL